MYAKRQKRLISYLKTELNVDVALIMLPVHIYYYTGFLSNPHERFFALLVDVTSGKTNLFVPSLDVEEAESVAKVDAFQPISDSEDPYDVLNKIVPKDANTFAIEKNYITVGQFEKIQAVFPKAKFDNVEPFIQQERLRKLPEEIEYVKQAIQITETGLKNMLETFKPGMTELQVKAALEYELTMLGAQGLSFDTLVLSGENSALPHGTSSQRKIKEGDFLLLDFGVHVNGYHSDITRTFIVGKGTEEQKKIYEIVKMANERAIESVKIGEPLKSVDQAARNLIEEKGYGNYFTHRVGHGLGLDVHEAPSIHSENDEIINPGLLFTIEPGIYVPGFGGVRIEDNIYVNKEGKIEVLTTFPKTWTEI